MFSEAQLPTMRRKRMALRLLMTLQQHKVPCSLLASQKVMRRLPSPARRLAGGARRPRALLCRSNPVTRPRQSRQQPSPEGQEGGKEGLRWPP